MRMMTVESGRSPARHVRPGWNGRSAITKAPGSSTAKCCGYTACVCPWGGHGIALRLSNAALYQAEYAVLYAAWALAGLDLDPDLDPD